jgi:thymidylate synthase (FAD)
LIKASYEILTPINPDEIYKILEVAGRKSHQSEYLMCDGSSRKFIKMIMDKGHYSVLEFFDIIVNFTGDRGFLAEIRTHRIGSFVAESTRFCNYSKDKFGNEITCIDVENGLYIEESNKDTKWKDESIEFIVDTIARSWIQSEDSYNELIKFGCSPQMARSVLPLGLKSEVVVKFNLRQWREVFSQRTSKAAHPQMRELMIPLCEELQIKLPEIFGDIKIENTMG